MQQDHGAVLLVTATFGLFSWSWASGADLKVARTVAVNTLVLFEVFYLLNCRLIIGSSASGKGLLGSRAVPVAIALVLGLQLLYTYAPPLQFLFESAALGWTEWPWMFAAGVLAFGLVEIEKAWQRQSLRSSIPQGRRGGSTTDRRIPSDPVTAEETRR